MQRLRFLAAPLGCGALFAFSACFPQFGEYGGNDASGGGGGAGVSAGGSGGAPLPQTCGADGFCIDVPTGWEGPVALSVPGGSCAGTYARAVATGETDIDGAPVTCGCECGVASGSTCPLAVVTRYLVDGCTVPADTTNVPSPGCTMVTSQNFASWNAMAAPVGGSCPATDLKQTPPIVFDERAVCAADAPPSCDGGLGCAPHPGEGFEPRICIWEDGDVDCTSASFAVKTLVFTEGHQDERQCDVACGCQAPSAICGGAVNGLQGVACGSAQDGVLVDGSCDDDYVGSNGSLSYASTVTSQGTCDPVPRAPIGEVVGVAPITLCCSGVL